jgi:hypothetical protein
VRNAARLISASKFAYIGQRDDVGMQRRNHLSFVVGLVLGCACALASVAARALPIGPRAFCEVYADAPACRGAVVSCAQCHDGPPNLNGYGGEVAAAFYTVDPSFDLSRYAQTLPAALAEIEGSDSDGDGAMNLEEIMLGTLPGDPRSHWVAPVQEGTLPNPYFDVGVWDPNVAMKRVSSVFCGSSPTYEELVALRDTLDPRALVHEKLAACLDSDHWKNEALHRLADNRIRPLKVTGADGDVVLADYNWDYRLFSYVLTNDRDARDLLLADYHVDEYGQVVSFVAREPFSLSGPLRIGTGQPVPANRRAGMITTQWFLVMNTMFSQLPRTTAAQAYRAYLGQDIAKGEGVHPVPGEPRDVDGKGVSQPACAACHATLDPLAYAFASYNGIELSNILALPFSNPLGAYNPLRTPWGGDGVLLDEPVADLLEWADRAANSDEFKRNLALMFFQVAVGRDPKPDDQDQFAALWRALPDDGYSANRLLHRIVDTDAFGVP